MESFLSPEENWENDHEIRVRRSRWVTALVSGDYAQGQGKLCQVDLQQNIVHCCLGVACEVYAESLGIEKRFNSYSGSYDYGVPEGVTSSLLLPDELRAYLALSVADQNVLVALNDDGVPFRTIAKAISNMAVSRN